MLGHMLRSQHSAASGLRPPAFPIMNPPSPTSRPQPEAFAGVRDVECIFPDTGGHPRGKIIKVHDCIDGKSLRIAQVVLLQTLTGDYADDARVGETDDDMLLLPDWSTWQRLPWQPSRGLLIHDCVGKDGELLGIAPRSVLRRVIAALARHQLKAVVAPELEFYLFQASESNDSGFQLPRRRDGSREAATQAAYSVDCAQELAGFWSDLESFCAALQLPADSWLHEMGPSQFEINLLHGDPLQAADQVVLFKYAVREAAARHGLQAIFMAKPLAGHPGSSMHIHQSLVDAAGHNVFSSADGQASPLFAHFLGGQQHYLPELSALLAPFMNSWRRYVRDSCAPINVEWGMDNRTAGLRVPPSDAAARRVENRLAGCDANPYLVIAASLAAGLAGIEERRQPRPEISTSSAYAAPRTLPDGLHEALRRLERSSLARERLGDHFVDVWCAVKHKELDHYMAEVSPWDRRFLSRPA